MYRTTTQPGDRRSDKDDEMIAVFQVNQSARTVMKLLKVPLLHCRSFLKGAVKEIVSTFELEQGPN